MKDSLQPGLSSTRRLTVDTARTIGFMGEDARVYATPALVADVETICRELLLDHLDAGEDSVGARVEIDHLAPTTAGMWVEITATIEACEGRMVTFGVEAQDAVEPIARGHHRRFVIDVDKTRARLAKKAGQAAVA